MTVTELIITPKSRDKSYKAKDDDLDLRITSPGNLLIGLRFSAGEPFIL